MGKLALNSRNKLYKQGIFIPLNKEKFHGKEAFYRSGLELSYFRLLDSNPNVVLWGSEEVVVPYLFENTWHKYYIDLFAVFKVGDELKKFLIEIKPYKQTIEPHWSAKRKQENYIKECQDYAKNLAKWKYGTEYAKKKGFEFHVLTEEDIMDKKPIHKNKKGTD